MTTDSNTDKKPEGNACGTGGGPCCGGSGKWVALVLLAVAVAVIVAREKSRGASGACCGTLAAVVAAETNSPVATGAVVAAASVSGLPRLVDLGAGKCIPCKMMAPILEDLKKTYAGKLDVQFIDVWENPEAGKPYGISMIPTQIFYGADGKELFRHEGFFAREDILAKWKEFGVVLAQ